MQKLFSAIANAIHQAEGADLGEARSTPITGGDINTCFRMDFATHRFFVKTNNHTHAVAMFRAEAFALAQLAAATSIRVPSAICQGAHAATAYLVLEFVALDGPADFTQAARELARLHQHQAREFGWPADNFIGSAVQPNRTFVNWAEFWWQMRLQPQLERAIDNGYRALVSHEAPLKNTTEMLLARHAAKPSLVHGDLWAGNIGFDRAGRPVLFDPASYYADREVDIAMTRVFGGFPREFYTTYESCLPLPDGAAARARLYNLYHLLNHLNLFGSSYLQRCLRTIATLQTR